MKGKVKQTIIVKKSVKVNTRAKAIKIAARHADRLYTSRETGTSFRFRQLPPSKFVKGSFKTERKKGVSIVWGKLKKKSS